MDNNNVMVPSEVKKWNWGAFMFNIYWGIGNNSYLPLLCFIPFFNIIWVFVCGFKGNEWAWKKGNYQDVNTFLAVQNTWNKAGLVSFILSIVLVALYFLVMIPLISSMFYYGF